MTEIAPAIRVVLAPNPGPMTLEGTNTWILGLEPGTSAAPSIVVDPGPLGRGTPASGPPGGRARSPTSSSPIDTSTTAKGWRGSRS